MERKKKEVKNFKFKEFNPPIDPPEVLISLNEYVSKHNSQRVLDNVIKYWFSLKDNSNPKKTKEEWDEIINMFHKETER